jgi:signal transduction histidine kinase
MRTNFRDARLIVASVLILSAGLAVLSYFMIAGEARRSRIITEYEADRMATALAESLRVRGEGDLAGLDPRVLGFGLYGKDGELLASYGSPPSAIDEDALRMAFAYDDKARILSLTRALGMIAMQDQGAMPGPLGMPGPPGMPGNDRPLLRAMRQRMGGQGRGFLYLSLDIGDYYRRKTLLNAASFLIPMIVACLAAVLLFLLASNLRYRKNAEERETLARLGESARTLAHEIRNPLGAIRIQTALARQRLGGESWPELDAIDEETQRLGSLSRRVGDFLKDPAGRPESVDLRAFLEELSSRSPYRPRFSHDGQGAAVRFDSELLRSAIENLLRNADESYESLPDRERSIELELSRGSGRAAGLGPSRTAGRESRRAVIAVRDRGVGIPEAARNRVFDPFYTDKVQGSGIGLPLARRFIEAAGGSLTLSPRPGGGTEARIVLPLEEPS